MLQHPAFLDRELCKELLEISKQDTSYTTVIGKTMCTYDFYEGKISKEEGKDQESIQSSTTSDRVVVSYKPKYVHEVLVNHLFKLAQEKSVVR